MKNVKPPSWERCSSKEKQPEKWGKTYHNKAAALYTSAFGNRISNSYNSCFASRGSLWQICAWWVFVGDIPRLGYCLGRQGASNVIAFFSSFVYIKVSSLLFVLFSTGLPGMFADLHRCSSTSRIVFVKDRSVVCWR